MEKYSLFKRYSFVWVTLGFFLFSLVGHWTAGWFAYKQEQQEHNHAIELSGYVTEMTRDTFENWQSEFLQLIWQVVGLTYFLYIGSSQSKEGDDRKEEKLDAILRSIEGKEGEKLITSLDKKYPRS